MRLCDGERAAILESVAALDPEAVVYLYGSRVDDRLRGGDIDLLIVSERLDFGDRITLLVDIARRLGEQKVDILVRKASELGQDPFARSVLAGALRL